jgi:5-methylcytosine-specific restriction endonuclease McrA
MVGRWDKHMERITARILERDGGTCWLCGLPGADTADHVIPRSRGGSNFDNNLRAAHRACNSKRGMKDVLPHARRSRFS